MKKWVFLVTILLVLFSLSAKVGSDGDNDVLPSAKLEFTIQIDPENKDSIQYDFGFTQTPYDSSTGIIYVTEDSLPEIPNDDGTYKYSSTGYAYYNILSMTNWKITVSPSNKCKKDNSYYFIKASDGEPDTRVPLIIKVADESGNNNLITESNNIVFQKLGSWERRIGQTHIEVSTGDLSPETRNAIQESQFYAEVYLILTFGD